MDPTAILSSAVVAAVVAGLIASQGTDLGFRVRPYDGVAMLRQGDDELIAKDPAGYGKAFDDVAATFDTDLRTLTQLWRATTRGRRCCDPVCCDSKHPRRLAALCRAG